MNGRDTSIGESAEENLDTSENISVDNTRKRSRQAADMENKTSGNNDSNKQLKTGNSSNDDLVPSVVVNSRISENANSNEDATIDEAVVIDSDSNSDIDDAGDGDESDDDDDVEIVEHEGISSGHENGSGKSKDIEMESRRVNNVARNETTIEKPGASVTVKNKEDDIVETRDTVDVGDGEDDDEEDHIKENTDKPKGQDEKVKQFFFLFVAKVSIGRL